MLTQDEKLIANRFQESCTTAYLNGGLSGFHKVAESYDPQSPAGFGSLVFFATNYYDIVAQDMANELEFSKSAVSKWTHDQAVPSKKDREAVKLYILRMLKKQITFIVLGPDE